MSGVRILAGVVLLAGCAVPASAPVSVAATAAYELVNLRQLPIPPRVSAIYFEGPLPLPAQQPAAAPSCLVTPAPIRVGQLGVKPEASGEPGLRTRPRAEPATSCPVTALAVSAQRSLLYFDAGQQEEVLGFLRDIRNGWSSSDSILQSGRQLDAALQPRYFPGSQHALHVMADGKVALTILVRRDYLEYVDVPGKKRAYRGINADDIARMQALGIYSDRT